MKHQEKTYAIINAAMEVLNTLGHGLLEKPYEQALAVELILRDIPLAQQKKFAIGYKDHQVGMYIPDLIVFGSVIVEVKTIDRITDHELGQLLNYLRIAELEVGLILNFKRAKLEWKRVVLDHGT
ncbi:MAG: GxxExxY protein [Flavobacteriales bacterium]|nr:GxxExxY protein [Flavobacteriales bacterium]